MLECWNAIIAFFRFVKEERILPTDGLGEKTRGRLKTPSGRVKAVFSDGLPPCPRPRAAFILRPMFERLPRKEQP